MKINHEEMKSAKIYFISSWLIFRGDRELNFS
jgi:hypothetical protein